MDPDAARSAEVRGAAGGSSDDPPIAVGGEDAVPLAPLLRRFTMEVDRFVTVFAQAHGLHSTDLDAVAHIWEAARVGRPLTAGELARRLSLTPAATSALLARLERAGHVRREHDLDDRRRVHVLMRPRAEELAVAFFTPLGRRIGAALADFDAAEVATTERVMTAVLAATRAAADEAHAGPPPPPAAP